MLYGAEIAFCLTNTRCRSALNTRKSVFCVCFVEHLDPNPILFRTSFQKTKNLEKTFTLISGCWETLKHANLIDFRGNCQVFIKESICKTLFLNFLKKVRIFLYLCFLQNLTNQSKTHSLNTRKSDFCVFCWTSWSKSHTI